MERTELRCYSTERLNMIASDLELITAELESPGLFSEKLNAVVSSGWPPGEYDREAMEFLRGKMIEGGDESAGWYGWYAVKRGIENEPDELVAAGGFFGPPDENGSIEIGYSVVEQFRGKGYAGEMVSALIKIASENPKVKQICAHTVIDNQASIKVLLKNGFRRSGEPDTEGVILFVLAL